MYIPGYLEVRAKNKDVRLKNFIYRNKQHLNKHIDYPIQKYPELLEKY